MAEKAKWTKGKRKRLVLMPGYGASVFRYVGAWGSQISPYGLRTSHATEANAKAYAEAELRRVLTEAIERLP